MATEYKIFKDSQELATVVYFGEVNGIISSIDISDASYILKAILGTNKIKPYTYKDLNEKINSKYGCTVKYREGSSVSNQITDTIESGMKVMLLGIYFEKIVDDISYNYNAEISFETN